MRTKSALRGTTGTCHNPVMTYAPFQPWFFRYARLQQLQLEWRAAIHAYDVALQAEDSKAIDKAGDVESRLCNACDAALKLLLRTPAPNLGAAAQKLEIAIEWQVEIGQLAVLLLDLRRMVFSPT